MKTVDFDFLQGHRLPPNRCHRFRHPRAQTTPHHSIIHAQKMIVYLAPNKFQISKGSPPPTQSLPQIPSSTRTNDPTSFDHPRTENDRLSSTQHISIFFRVTGSHPIVATDSVIHAHKRPHIIRSSTHRKYQSTIQHSSKFKFLRGHRLPPIDYARPRRQQSPISTLHLALLHRSITDLGVHVSDNIRKI